ncbi:MAG: AAA family ATPase [Candidatus Woesearchaeota archaeon]|nr:MAG: AAA family ATPase [Candidatus Woesearchaeota archaeon]
MFVVFGITGTLGAGKGEIANFFVSQKNFAHYSVTAFLIEEINRRKLPVNRDSMVLVANDLRKVNGPGYIVDLLLQRAKKVGKPAIIESIRTSGEVETLRKEPFFKLLAVDADPTLRYERVFSRKSEKDKITFEEFLSNEQREMHATDKATQNLSYCIEHADFQLTNNGSLEELYAELEELYNDFST